MRFTIYKKDGALKRSLHYEVGSPAHHRQLSNYYRRDVVAGDFLAIKNPLVRAG